MQILFFLIFLAIWGGGHIYIGWSLGAPLNPGPRNLVWGSIFLLFVAGIAAQVTREWVEVEPFYTAIQWIGSVSMGVACVLFSLLVLKDLGWLGFLAVERVAGGEEGFADEERRRFLLNGLNAGAVAATAAATKWGIYQARRMPDLVEVDLPVANLSEALKGFRIVQLSDLHVGPTVRRDAVAKIVERVNELDPDLVAITGDLAEGRVAHIWKDIAPILELKSRHGVFYCTGNHEYYWEALKWCEALDEAGVAVLNNGHQMVDHDGGRVLVAGCTDLSAHRFIEEHRSDPKKAKAGAEEHDFSLLLAHQPGSIHDAAEAGFDLQLSGHTHGGQFWPGNLLVGHFHPFSVGLHREDRTWIYVSRGTGYWGPPMRLKAPSEITVLRLIRGGPEQASVTRKA